MGGTVVDAFDARDGGARGAGMAGARGFAFGGGGEVFVFAAGELVGTGVLGVDSRGLEGGHVESTWAVYWFVIVALHARTLV